mgnify:CR=1 FL=1
MARFDLSDVEWRLIEPLLPAIDDFRAQVETDWDAEGAALHDIVTVARSRWPAVRILVVGAEGTVGKAAISGFSKGHEIIKAGRKSGDVHVDVMDGHFVPNLTIGAPVVACLRPRTDLYLDCHLMIENPDRWATGYAEAGAYNVTVHVEAADDPVMLAKNLRAAGSKAGLAIKPNTPLEPYVDVLRHYDTLLVMSVEPGFGGQKFIAEVLGKVVAVLRSV